MGSIVEFCLVPDKYYFLAWMNEVVAIDYILIMFLFRGKSKQLRVQDLPDEVIDDHNRNHPKLTIYNHLIN